MCTGTNNKVLGNFATVGGGDNNKASGEYSTIPCGRGNKAKGKGSIVLGHNGMAIFDQALVVNIPLQSGKVPLKSTSSAEFLMASNRLIFQIESTRVVITRNNIKNIKKALNEGSRHLMKKNENSDPLLPIIYQSIVSELSSKKRRPS